MRRKGGGGGKEGEGEGGGRSTTLKFLHKKIQQKLQFGHAHAV